MEMENNLELKWEVYERTLHRMANVHNLLEMWQSTQNLYTKQKESWAQNKQMPAVGYFSDTEEILKAFWLNFQHNGVAACILSERSSLPPTLSAMILPGGWAEVLIVRQKPSIDCHSAESNEDTSPEVISNTANCLSRNGQLNNTNQSEADGEADNESDGELDTSFKDPESPELWDVSATPNVPGWIWPIQKLKNTAEKKLMTVNAMETWRNNSNKKR